MAFEAVVGKEAPHVGVAGEQNAIKIERLALVPVGTMDTSINEGTGVTSSVTALMRMRWLSRGDRK